MQDKTFKLEILTPDRAFFSGDVQQLIVNTTSGSIGIMRHTLPLVTVLTPGVIKILQYNKWMEAVSAEGFITVERDCTTIMAQLCEWPYEVNAEKADEEILDLNERMKKVRSAKEYKLIKAQLAIQLARLKVRKKDL